MELVVIALISLLSIIIIGFVIHNSKKSLVEFKDQNNKLIRKNLSLLEDLSKKEEHLKQVLRNKEEEKQLHKSFKEAYERILSELYFQNKEVFNKIPHHYTYDNKIVIRQPVPLPHFEYTNGDSPLSAELKYETKVVDLVNIELVNDSLRSPYFYITQGKGIRGMFSIGPDYALLPEMPEEIAVRLTKEILCFLTENKYKLKY